MTLTELKEFVQARRIVSLKEISMHFRTDESAVEAMMERWIRKGVVKKIEMTEGSCGGCIMCSDGVKCHYEWQGPQAVTFRN